MPAGPECPATMQSGDVCVDGDAGSDAASVPGTAAAPVKSLTHALSIVGRQGSGRTIYLMPARYDAANGEAFPIVIPAGVVVRGTIPVAATEQTATTASQANAAVVLADGPILTMQGGAKLANVIALAEGSTATDYQFVSDGGIADVTLENVYFHGGSAKIASFYVQGGTVRIQDSQLGPSLFLSAGKHLVATGSTLFGDGDDTPISLFGTATLSSVTLRPERGTISLTGDVSAHGLTIESSSPNAGKVTIGPASAQLDVQGLAVTSSSLSLDTVVPQLLTGATATNATLDCSDCKWQALQATGSILSGKRLDIADSMLAATAVSGHDRLKLRQSELSAGSTIHVIPVRSDLPQSAFDLGTQASPGGNTFTGTPGSFLGRPAAFLVVEGDIQVFASGNTWLPNDSGADATGSFAVGTTLYDAVSGNNINKHADSIVHL